MNAPLSKSVKHPSMSSMTRAGAMQGKIMESLLKLGEALLEESNVRGTKMESIAILPLGETQSV